MMMIDDRWLVRLIISSDIDVDVDVPQLSTTKSDGWKRDQCYKGEKTKACTKVVIAARQQGEYYGCLSVEL
jgi:hypothetical protein